MTKYIYLAAVLFADVALLGCIIYAMHNRIKALMKQLETERRTSSNMIRGNIILRDERDALKKQLEALGVKACDLQPVSVEMQKA